MRAIAENVHSVDFTGLQQHDYQITISNLSIMDGAHVNVLGRKSDDEKFSKIAPIYKKVGDMDVLDIPNFEKVSQIRIQANVGEINGVFEISDGIEKRTPFNISIKRPAKYESGDNYYFTTNP